MGRKPSNYYKTNAVFHNEFLEILEDCVTESSLKPDEKYDTILVLYQSFFDCKAYGNVVKLKFKPRYIL